MIAARHRQFPGGMAISALCVALSMALYAAATPAHAQTAVQEAVQQYDIPAGPLPGALSAWGAQSGQQLVFPPDLVAGKTSRAVSGRYTAGEALRRLLQGSGLEAQDAGDAVFTLRQAAASRTEPQVGSPNTQAPEQPAEPEIQELGIMTITGTRIRGGATPSPVITIGSERIQEEGFTDLGEVIRSVPQNFSGGQNPGVIPFTVSGAGLQNQNVTGGAGLNLRGLGPDASLTLLNGRRMAYGGFSQSVDISAIPIEVVDRIDIVADGASAIYGSDAVGGVGNVVLKRDFEGVSIGASYGKATDGGLSKREYSATAGSTWTSGGVIAAITDASTDPIFARQRRYSDHLTEPYTLYPASDLSSGLVSAHQFFGESVELRFDAFKAKRSQNYAVVSDPTATQALPDTTTSFVSPGVDVRLPNDWTLMLGGSWAKSEHVQEQSFSAIGATEPYLTTRQCYCNRSQAYEVSAEGPLMVLPGGEARLAVGGGRRTNDYLQFDYEANVATTQGSDASRFAYAELDLPLAGQESGLAGVHRLSLTAALRTEDYDDFGRVSTPKLGLIYAPGPDLTIKASWGRSFKAPTLHQRYYMHYALLDNAPVWGGEEGAAVLVTGGGNRDLGAERARTWAASLSYHPVRWQNLDLELAWFDIDYRDRVVEPLATAWETLANPIYGRFVVRNPSDLQQSDLIGSIQDFYNYTGAPYDPSSVVALISAQFVNVAQQRIRGIDLSGNYRVDLASGRLALRGSVGWLNSTQQTFDGQQKFDLAGTLHNPPRLTSRLGAIYSVGGVTASTFVNYKSGVRNAALDEKTSSFTTVDAVLRFDLAEHGPGAGLEFALSAQNLFNRPPPLYTVTSVFSIPPYDATNYSPIGRFLNMSVAKRW